ncbi:hypothetical protein DFH09DRAFT_1373194 [Mycena vulgaris]|nr:hypothetical protein DFH09DRAFT_1373194 [Mycena vulgaris]
MDDALRHTMIATVDQVHAARRAWAARVASADASKFTQFGREVFGVDPANLTSEQFGEIREALYKHDVLVFRNAALTPKQQYALTKEPGVRSCIGEGRTQGRTKKSLLGPFILIPSVPQVQLIGNGTVYDHEGIEEAKLKHRSHKTFHKTIVSPKDEAAGATRFYRWDIDCRECDGGSIFGDFVVQ